MKYTALWLSLVITLVGIAELLFGVDMFVLDKTLVWQEPWRLVTSIFAHADILHYLLNVSSLLLFGLILEGRIGASKTLYLFLFTGIVVNVLSPYQQSLGASGAVYGIFGALAMLRPLMVVWVEYIPVPMILAGTLWIIADIIGLFIPDSVAHLAHIGGLIIGIVYGLWWRTRGYGDSLKRNQRRKDVQIEHLIDEFEKREGLR